MPVATKTKRCPSCGTKNSAEADRCRICTRNDRPPQLVAARRHSGLLQRQLAGAQGLTLGTTAPHA